jgi:hypothetical protein
MCSTLNCMVMILPNTPNAQSDDALLDHDLGFYLVTQPFSGPLNLR